jgi:hypothetical protein
MGTAPRCRGAHRAAPARTPLTSPVTSAVDASNRHLGVMARRRYGRAFGDCAARQSAIRAVDLSRSVSSPERGPKRNWVFRRWAEAGTPVRAAEPDPSQVTDCPAIWHNARTAGESDRSR